MKRKKERLPILIALSVCFMLSVISVLSTSSIVMADTTYEQQLNVISDKVYSMQKNIDDIDIYNLTSEDITEQKVGNQNINTQIDVSQRPIGFETIQLPTEVPQIPEMLTTAAIATETTPEAVEVQRVINLTDINQKSGLTAEEFDAIINDLFNEYHIQNSCMTSGLGEVLCQIENEDNINGLLALSVATLESGWGKSNVSQCHNNFFGIGSSNGYRDFASKDECIKYFGNMIRANYLDQGYNTISSISEKYCPPNHINWSQDVNWFMGQYADAYNHITVQNE